MRIAIVANTAWYLLNFRLNLMHALQQQGHEVVAVGPPDDARVARLLKAGIHFEAVPISGSSVNPFRELLAVVRLWRVFRKNRIEMVFSYTPKGNIYSALAARCMGATVVPNISGVGGSFSNSSMLGKVVAALYRITLGRAHHVFFQNLDDMNVFTSRGLVQAGKCTRLPGSGVDLKRFTPEPLQERSSTGPVFLLVARLLWSKGVGEFAKAAYQIKAKHPDAQFQLLGFLDVDNPAAVPREQVDAWQQQGLVQYLGATDDVRPYLLQADCVVLPSYYGEGVPRTLLEAAACARAVVTTDSPGCRDTVQHGQTGYLCRPRDVADLAKALDAYIALSPAQRCEMGLKSRQHVEQQFDEQLVLNAYIDVLLNMQAGKN